MRFLIILIGAFIILMGISLLINPDFILNLIETNKDSQGLYVFGILFRTVIGILLVLSANSSKHPTIVSILGFFSLLAALVLVISLICLGEEAIPETVSSIISDYKSYTPISAVFSIVTGGFLIYAFVGRK